MTVIGTLISERYRLEEKIGSGGHVERLPGVRPDARALGGDQADAPGHLATTRTSSSASGARPAPWRS